MAIISVLIGGVVIAVLHVTQRTPEFETHVAIQKAQALVQDWQRRFEQLPPSEIPEAENEINGPIEAVYQALHTPGFTGAEYVDAELCNTDRDRLPKPIGKASAELMELRDGWGNPLVYFARGDYGKHAGNGVTYRTSGPGQKDVEARPWRARDGSFVNPHTFQIYSMGPDGLPNTEDDITAWRQS